MPDSRQPVAIIRRLVAWSLAWLLAGALYLLLIDTTSLPELFVGIGAAALAATGFELAREQHVAGQTVLVSRLARVYRPLLKVFGDIAIVSYLAVRQLFTRATARGRFRAVRFRRGEDETKETGRRALAEAFGSFAPNTIIIGIDEDRELILAHQLKRTGGPDAIDLLELG